MVPGGTLGSPHVLPKVPPGHVLKIKLFNKTVLFHSVTPATMYKWIQ